MALRPLPRPLAEMVADSEATRDDIEGKEGVYWERTHRIMDEIWDLIPDKAEIVLHYGFTKSVTYKLNGDNKRIVLEYGAPSCFIEALYKIYQAYGGN
jgi:hypothetical protein